MERISKIRIKGGFYSDSIDIILGKNTRERVSVIYGSNGSGKSSIADALFEYAESIDELSGTYEIIELLDENSRILELEKDSRKNIWVYCDRYIEKNINWQEDRLGAIVIFGEQADIDEEIKSLRIEIETIIDTRKGLNLEKYNDTEGRYSLGSAKEAVFKQLKLLWAVREKNIRKISRNAPVNEGVITEILASKKAGDSISNLKKEYEKKIKEYENLERYPYKYNFLSVPDVDLDILNTVPTLLSERISEPVVQTNMEKKLVKLIDEGLINMVDSSHEYFSNKNSDECPYCLQTVSEQHKDRLIDTIKKVLNDEVENHIDKLNRAKESLNEMQIEVDYLRGLDIDIDNVNKLLEIISRYNAEIRKTKEQIDRKIRNLFIPINNKVGLLSNIYESIVIEARNLNSILREHNNMIDDKWKMQKELLELNKRMACLEIADLNKEYVSILNLMKEEEKIINNTENRIDELNNKITQLKVKKQRVDIALEEINKGLVGIFAGANRLKLEPDSEGNYRVTSRGKSVRLKKLSAGEKNIISLCYFFANINNYNSINEAYTKKCLILLDDPISSVDYDNKIGIYTFLKKHFSQISSMNPKSRIIVFTHDLDVIYKIDKVLCEIKKELSMPKFYGFRKFCSNKNTETVDPDDINSYAWNIKSIYEYAVDARDEHTDEDMYIGNLMRKTLEAYATFNLKTGITGLCLKTSALDDKCTTDLSEYFRERMFRLLLNNESHTKEKASALTERGIYEEFSKEERRQTARDILCFLYLINPEHIKAYLSSAELINDIERWKRDLEKRVTA